MKRFLACLALCASLSASAQVVYPYNPDANGDSAITSGDLLDFLPAFATTFTPQGITIDGVSLDEWLADLEVVVNSNASSIESLFAMQSQINALETANDNLQAQINSLQEQLNNLTFSVDGLPPCIDLDNDDICDFADACPPVVVSFSFYDSSYNVELFGELLVADGSYSFAQLQDLTAPNACLSGIDLGGASLNFANLQYANLSGTNLSGAIFSNADLTGADFSGADLTDAFLSSANFTDANLSSAILQYANLTNAILSGAILGFTNLTGANLQYANLSGTNLSGADLENATMTCLNSCPVGLPPGYTCEPDPDCYLSNRYRIVPD